jgi:hypothetical protein
MQEKKEKKKEWNGEKWEKKIWDLKYLVYT